MKIEKKLEIFRQVIMKEVDDKNKQLLRELNESFDNAVEDAARAAAKQARERVRLERYKIDRGFNKDVVAAAAKAKRELITLRETRTDALFDEIKAEIQAFTESEAYEEYLLRAVIKAQADGTEANPYTYVQLLPKDMRYAARITYSTRLTVEAAEAGNEAGWLGGFRLLTGSRRVIADYTLAARIEEKRSAFSMLINMDAPNGGVA